MAEPSDGALHDVADAEACFGRSLAEEVGIGMGDASHSADGEIAATVLRHVLVEESAEGTDDELSQLRLFYVRAYI